MRNLYSQCKKGQIQSLTPAVLALVFAAVILVFGLVITQELTNTVGGVASRNDNETITTAELETGSDSISVDRTSFCNAGTTSFVAINVSNASASADGANFDLHVGAGNYTFTTAGVFTNLTSEYVTDDFNITYSFSWGSEACIAGNKTVVGLGTFADFWEIIVLAVVIAVVIGLLLIVFGGSVRRR